MRRSSRSIKLVLISSLAMWPPGCGRSDMSGYWVTDADGTRHFVPSTQPSSGRYSGSSYHSYSSGSHYWSSGSSSSGSGSSGVSHSSGTSRGGFGSSGHSASS